MLFFGVTDGLIGLCDLLARFGVRPDSILGMYLRHCIVSFEEMFYEHLSRLAAEVSHYVKQFENQRASAISGSPLPNRSTMSCRKEGPVLDKFLNHQVAQVGKGVCEDVDLAQHLQDLKGLEPDHPKLLLWQHGIAVKRRDYLAAMDSLLR